MRVPRTTAADRPTAAVVSVPTLAAPEMALVRLRVKAMPMPSRRLQASRKRPRVEMVARSAAEDAEVALAKTAEVVAVVREEAPVELKLRPLPLPMPALTTPSVTTRVSGELLMLTLPSQAKPEVETVDVVETAMAETAMVETASTVMASRDVAETAMVETVMV